MAILITDDGNTAEQAGVTACEALDERAGLGEARSGRSAGADIGNAAGKGLAPALVRRGGLGVAPRDNRFGLTMHRKLILPAGIGIPKLALRRKLGEQGRNIDIVGEELEVLHVR